MEIEIPEKGKVNLKYSVSDFTGTLSIDGNLVSGVKEKLNQIAQFFRNLYFYCRYFWKG